MTTCLRIPKTREFCVKDERVYTNCITAHVRLGCRLVRTWRGGSFGFGEVLDGMGRVVKGVTEVRLTASAIKWLILSPKQE